MPPPPIESFSRIRSRFRAVLFDAYGVLNDSSGLLNGISAALRRLRDEGVPFFIVTNDASQPPARIAAKYADAAGPLVDQDQIVCAGHLATHHLLAHFPNATVACLGPAPSQHYITAAGNTILTPETWGPGDHPAAFLLMDEGGFPWERDLNRTLNFLRENPATALITPNPDLTFRCAEGLFGLGVGALATMLEAALARPFLRLGKPAPALFELGLAKARCVVPNLLPEETLMVGDTLTTDIVGARTCGLKTALVLSGNTHPSYWQEEIRLTGVVPDYVARSVSED